jgi:hypothetical protein
LKKVKQEAEAIRAREQKKNKSSSGSENKEKGGDNSPTASSGGDKSGGYKNLPSATGHGGRKVKDMAYYDVLEVQSVTQMKC